MRSKIVYVVIVLLLTVGGLEAQIVTLTVEQCRTMAKKNSAAVLNAVLEVDAAVAQRGEALAEYFPTVSAMAFGFHALNPMLEIGIQDILGKTQFTNDLQAAIDRFAPEYGINTKYQTLHHGGMATLTLMQPIFAGGRIVAGNNLAKLGVEAARLKRDIAFRTSDEQVDNNFWQVVSLQEKEQSLKFIEQMLDTILRDAESAVGAGLVAKTDLMQVRLKQSELRVGQLQLTNGICLAKMNLLNAIDMNYSYIERGVDTIPFIDNIVFDGSLADLLPPTSYYKPEEEIAANLEEMQLLDLSVKAQQLQRRMVLGEALPQLALGANYGYSNLMDKGSWNGAIYAVLQVPITDWGKKTRAIQRLDRKIEMAENDREYLQQQVLLQIRQLWLNLSSSWQQMVVSREARDLAQTSVDESRAYYRSGMISISELLQAQSALTTANETYINQAINYTTALNSYLSRIK